MLNIYDGSTRKKVKPLLRLVSDGPNLKIDLVDERGVRITTLLFWNYEQEEMASYCGAESDLEKGGYDKSWAAWGLSGEFINFK